MKTNIKKTIGIIGGMGPMATVNLFYNIVKLTDASCDMEHIRVLIDNRPDIPDRTKALLKGGESPVPMIVESGRNLAVAGADFIIIPCNTSHAFYHEIASQIPLPILHMIEETANELVNCGIHRAGLIATSGTIATGVYHRIFEERGIELVVPSNTEQHAIMSLIYDGVKASNINFDISRIKKVIHNMLQKSAEVIILGCTELPLAVQFYGIEGNFIDPGLILAKAAIRKAGYCCVLDKKEAGI